ncbi:D-serine deaminase-like pyridoxal phosphate-dependent protein [Pseudarthrobacter siccitolerans]|uniref:D-serine deaminase-like pyridoxal phosphate-dependent protein n=1 Tax=Pseudarthrobacter siccitolerans TaxID=861266 RepID=A0ABU0PKX1_9MICC|nr:alanine racemase [Pseudarthrobacter siccitolerans]MDQ0674585.1 D-serine deaminase-like pyridoxal phosphate-dependent protein [Pseudarthrobacter siccitolerans]
MNAESAAATIPADIDTPEILVDVDVLDRNITRMARAVQAKGLVLRPHAKTHKIPEIAARQLAAGAVGLTVATIGEAEVFAASGVQDLFIAYPLWVSPQKAVRLRQLVASAKISVGVDSAAGASALGAGLGDAAGEISVLVEIDSGHHRSGVQAEAAAAVAQAASGAGLKVAGVFTFPGHSYAPGMPVEAAVQEQDALHRAAEALGAAGFEAAVRSGGSTPTALLTEGSAATEVRPGVYVFGDAQQLELGRCALEDIALAVAATVVSHHTTAPDSPQRFILDAGSKILGSDRPAWASGFGRLMDHPGARITALSEHHATVEWHNDGAPPAIGTRLRVIPNHVCLAINLVDDVAVVSQGRLTDRWAVAARGKNK